MKKLVFISLSFLLFSVSLIGQFNQNEYCPVLSEDNKKIASRSVESLLQVGGAYKPASNSQTQNEYFKVLIVFAQFSDDIIQSSVWPLNQRPTYANNIIDQTKSSSYRSGTLSDYWKVMSHGNFDFIGDVYSSLVVLPSKASYQSAGKGIDDVNKDVLTAIDPNVNFSNYDNWKYEGDQFIFSEHNADGYVDMIFICYRELFNANGWYAWASLGLTQWTVTKDSKSIYCPGASVTSLSSGLTIQKAANTDEYTMKQTMIHEFGHFLFGACHTSTGGIMGDAGNVARTLALSGWESERLGYIAYTVVNQNGFTAPLGDYITDGDVLKVPIPITNPSSTTFFVVENHRRLSMYDQIMRGGALGGTTNLGNGIYIHYITNGNSSCCSNEWRTADGSWNWVQNGTISMPAGWPPVMPLTKRSSINRNSGKSDRHPQNIYWYDGSQYSWWAKWHDQDPSTGTYSLTRDIMGDEFDAFNFGYNELFTPWSNPSTYSSGATNISVQLYSSNGSEITVKVFTTYASSLALPPSKPQALTIGPNPGNGLVRLEWAANIEPDFSLYQVWRKIDWAEDWKVLGSTTNGYFIDQEMMYLPNYGLVTSHYKIRAKDTQGLYSTYSNEVTSQTEPLGKDLSERTTDKYFEYKIQNYPNPFNPTTNIVYQIKEKGFVSLKVFDILGREVSQLVNETKEPGEYFVTFDASDLTSGIYIYSLIVNDSKGIGFVSNQKMTLVK